MTTKTLVIKQQIYQIIEILPKDRLPDILHFLKQLLPVAALETQNDVAPVYQIHQYAVNTGITDLAAQHDHYLYGANKNND